MPTKLSLRPSARRWAVGLAAAMLLATAGGAGAAARQDELARGPRVGAAIPHQLALRDQTGTARTFRTLRGKKGLILLFNRSFDW